jgi:hypothetical protein
MKPVECCLDAESQRLGVSQVRHLGVDHVKPLHVMSLFIRYVEIPKLQIQNPVSQASNFTFADCYVFHIGSFEIKKKNPLPSNRIFRFVHVCKQISSKGL